MASSDVVLVLTTLPDLPAAQNLAQVLLEGRWAACVTVMPSGISWYRWQGAIEQAHEVVVVIKTTSVGWPELQEALIREHPYDVPEILMWRADAAVPAYAAWVGANVGS
jgi:periplasmic divalent cation tolerance protein